MVILLVFFGLTLVCGIAGYFYAKGIEKYDINGFYFACLVFGIIFVVILIIVPISRMDDLASIAGLRALEKTFNEARENSNISEFELAAIQQSVAEKNAWIASSQFWARHPLTNWFWHPDILGLEPIK